MLRRPSSVTSPGAATGTDVLPRRGSARATLGGTRRRPVGRDVPVQGGPAGGTDTPADGIVPRMRRPRGTTELTATPPSGRPRTKLDAHIDRQLARLRGTAPAARPGTIDDDRARQDPETASFAAIRPSSPAPSSSAPAPARVATAADRPSTAQFPAVSALSPAQD